MPGSRRDFGLAPDDGEGLRRALNVDFRRLDVPYRGAPLHAEVPERKVDPLWGWRTKLIAHGSGEYWDFCDFPLVNADEQTVDAWPMPSPGDFDYSGVASDCQAHGSYAIHAGDASLACIINTMGFLFGMEQTLVDLACESPPLLRCVDRFLGVQLEVTRRTLEAAGGRVDFLWIGEDLGTQIGPLIGIHMFRTLIRPRHQKFIDLAKAYDLPVMIHTCGSSSWAYEDYIEMGVKAVDTLQPEARDMSPRYLKGRFGGRLAFHGCISTAGPVAKGSVQDTVQNCRETLEIMMPGGGYCFAPTHALQDNSPTQNVLAMFETARQCGGY